MTTDRHPHRRRMLVGLSMATLMLALPTPMALAATPIISSSIFQDEGNTATATAWSGGGVVRAITKYKQPQTANRSQRIRIRP